MRADPGLPHAQPTPAFWQSPPHPLSGVRSSELPSAAGTVVIGSGITACSLVKALLEKDPHASIVVCEARGLASGATGRNGGHLVSSAVRDFSSLRATFGTEIAVKIASFTLENVERVFEVARECGPEVEEASEIRRVDKVLALRDAAALGDLEGSLKAFERHMPEKWRGQVRLVDRSDLEKVSLTLHRTVDLPFCASHQQTDRTTSCATSLGVESLKPELFGRTASSLASGLCSWRGTLTVSVSKPGHPSRLFPLHQRRITPTLSSLGEGISKR